METVRIERDGIAYTLTVIECDDCYQVRWECPVCGVVKDVRDWCDSESHAIDRGEAQVFADHHLPVHVMGVDD